MVIKGSPASDYLTHYLRTLGYTISLLAYIVNRADHHEGLFGQVITFSIQDLAETAHCFFERHIASFDTCKAFCHKERLGEEALDLARPRHHELVVFAQLVDAEDGD